MKRWKKWEMALLLGLCAALIWGAWAAQRQDALAQKMIRLHVIANSDSDADQALKLQVRDAVLARATELLTQSADMTDAWSRLEDALPALEQTASAACGGAYPVRAELAETEFPLKEYDGFSLPAGEYTALRLVIGDGAGRNWWCVVYPPLCTAAAADLPQTAADAGMSDDDLGLITEENPGYVLKFRSLELWEQLRQWLGKR